MNAPKQPAAFVPQPGFTPIHREDVAVFFHCASDTFGQLAALFDAIGRQLNEHDELHKLAMLGRDVAQDYENITNCWGEQAEKGGVTQ